MEQGLKSPGGNKEQALQAVQQAASQTTQGIAGTFEKVVQVAGQNVTVTGKIVDGVARVGTAFITK